MNTLTFTSSIGRKLDHTVCLFTRVGERPSHLCFENVAEDGKIRGPSEGYPELINVWKEMEKLLDTGTCFVCILVLPARCLTDSLGKVKSIGVSNFSIKTLSVLLPHCKVIPVTNQIEMHPCLPQEDLKSFCEEKGILVTAYSPLGE